MGKEKVNNSIILSFLGQILKDKRYWILLVFFMILLFFGQNILPNNAVEKNLKNINIPEITSNSTTYESKGQLNSKPGESYHILFQIKVKNGDDTLNMPSETVRFGLTDNLGNSRNFSTLNIQANTDSFTNEDIVFTTDRQYQNLNFQKNDLASQSIIFIKNIHLVRLEGGNKIKASFMGDFDNSKPAETLSYTNANSVLAVMDNKNKEVGEIFTATSDYLMGVKMKLHFRGNGGNGNYQLAIKEVTNENISKASLAEFGFNQSTAEAIYRVDNANEIYLFPIGAKLVPGQKYFIGINSQNIKSNFFNNLRIFGSLDGSKDTDSRAISVDLGKIINQTGNFYIKYYFANQQIYNGEKANFGDKFDDLGNGTGIYSYASSSAHTDLDIFESGENFVTYKIDTFYPFNTMYLEASFADSYLDSDSRLSYSFNNKDWSTIEKKKNINLTNQYEQQIKGDGQSKTLYIKSVGQASDKTTFDLNSLNIHANVNINN